MKTNAKQLAAARRAMEVIAAREGISVEEVRREISLAILMAQPRDAGIVSEIPCAGAAFRKVSMRFSLPLYAIQ